MKKLSSIALLSLALVACKKENSTTVTKVDPSTGKTVTVEVPADSVKTVVAQPAIGDSAGVFTQKFKLEKGQKYPFVTVQKDQQTITNPQGQSMTGTNESVDEMSFEVVDFKDGIYDIKIHLIAKTNKQTANGKTIEVSTKKAAPKEEQLKIMWNVNKALTGNHLNLKLKEDGSVISITGFDTVYKKVDDIIKTVIKDSKQRTEFSKGFKATFDEKMLKGQLEKNLKLLPKKGVKVGGKWTQTENATPDGKVKLTSNYILKSVGNGEAEIGISGGIPKQSDKQSQQNFTHTMSSELTQSGSIVLDQNTGWIKKQVINVKTTQIETLSDGKESQSMKNVSNSTVSVNP